ncbi:MAG TPA: hypothetical protein VI758_01040, partial [Bacteroidota bacterium]
TVTNVALGLAVFLSLLAVSRVVFQELRARAGLRSGKAVIHRGNGLNLESLGITMNDGGEPINEMSRQTRPRAMDPDDPPNITRSEN